MYIHTHIPKTAGTTLLKLASKNVKTISRIHTKHKDFAEGRKLSISKKVKWVNGHCSFGIHEYLGIKKPKYVVFIRNPIQRWISSFYDVVHRTSFIYNEWKKCKFNIIKFIDFCINEEMNTNIIVKQISGLESLNNVRGKRKNMYLWAGRKTKNTANDMNDLLVSAKENIKKYFFVGCQERAGNNYKLLSKICKWGKRYDGIDKSTFSKKNRINKIFKIDFNNEDVLKKLEKCNEYDLEFVSYLSQNNINVMGEYKC